ncbi:hypothetical protein CR513_04505, partial [Mucuna pruriens]
MLSKARLPKHFWGEAIYTIVHVINLIPTVALNTKVLDKIWFGKDVKLGSVSSLGMVRMSMVISCMILLRRNFVRSYDVQFMEDQTIEDIDKVKKTTPKKENNLSKIDPVRMPVHDLDTIDNNVQNGEKHNYVGDQ